MMKVRDIFLLLILFLSTTFASAQETNYTLVQQLGGRGRIHDVKWSPDGELLAVASDQGVWLYTDTLEDNGLLPTNGEFDAVTGVVWSADSSRIFASNTIHSVGKPGESIYAWDVSTSEILVVSKLDSTIIADAAWDPDSVQLTLLLRHEQGTTLSIFDPLSIFNGVNHRYDGRELNEISWNKEGTSLIAIEKSPDGTLALTLDAATGEILDTVSAVADSTPSPDGSLLAVLDGSGLLVQDVASGETLHTFEVGGESRFIRWDEAFWNHDGSKLISYVLRQSRVVIFDMTTGDIAHELQSHPDLIIRSIDVHPQSDVLAISFLTGILELYDLNTGERLEQRWTDLASGIGISWSPDSSMIATVNASDPLVRIWDAKTWSERDVLELERNFGFSVVWSPDGSMIAAGNNALNQDESPLVMIWDTETKEVTNALPVEDSSIGDMVWSLDWSSDSQTIVATRPSNQTGVTALRSWNVETGELLMNTDGHFLFDTDVSPISDFLATMAFNSAFEADGKNVLQVWDMTTGEFISEVELPEELRSPRGLQWHSIGQIITATDTGSSSVYFWDLNHGYSRGTVEVPEFDRMFSMGWHSEGYLLAILGSDDQRRGMIQIWMVAPSLIAEHSQTIEMDRLVLSPMPISWSPDGKYFAVGTNDGAIMIYGEE